MLGHLPLRHRLAVWVGGLLSFAGVGAWLAHTTPVPLVWSSGAVLAVLLGALAIAAFLHLLVSDPRPQTRSTNSAR
jgi:ABC-type Na+ efflux pump permease subunit